MSYQRWNIVEITLCNVVTRCISVVQRWKTDVGICFIFNIGSALFQRWSTTLKQDWPDVEMFAGLISAALAEKKDGGISKGIGAEITW